MPVVDPSLRIVENVLVKVNETSPKGPMLDNEKHRKCDDGLKRIIVCLV